MSIITFDKLAYIDKLKSSGISEEQARAQAEALEAALKDTVATKADIAELKNDLLELKADLLKWVVGLLLAQAALVATLVKLLE